MLFFKQFIHVLFARLTNHTKKVVARNLGTNKPPAKLFGAMILVQTVYSIGVRTIIIIITKKSPKTAECFTDNDIVYSVASCNSLYNYFNTVL